MLVLDFIYSVISADAISTLYQVKNDFVAPKELEYLQFVKEFYSKHSKLPDVATVEGKFSITMAPNTEPPDYWKNEIINAYQNSIVETAIAGSAKDKKKAIEIFQTAIISYNVDIDSKVVTHDAGRKSARYQEVKRTGGITHFSTGNPDIDQFSLGYKKADLWTIGGTEGSGKTWFLCRMANWLDYLLLNSGIARTILFVSGEMDAEELEERLDALRTQLSYALLSRGALNPGEERKYLRYLASNQTNIKIIDNFDGLKDVDYFATVFNPAAIFLDGSHLMAKSYEWTDVARVSADMKKISRNKKVPFINTTHLKAGEGKSAQGGSIDSFAYSKGYTRDSDIAGVLFGDDMMQLENKMGIDWVKVRRGNRTRMIWEQDYNNMGIKLVDSLSGQLLAAARIAAPGADPHKPSLYTP